jgi:peptidoglycan/xylan/chitin deacetylase (PgdA/CDA1 family)
MWSVLGNCYAPGGAGGRLVILMFHRVLSQPDPMFPEDHDAAAFEAQLELLARHFRVLPLPEAIPLLFEKRLPARAVCITFDDGYADNAEIALPILRRHGLHATFFVATGFLDGGRMWNDSVIEAVRRAQGQSLDFTDLGFGRYPVSDFGSKRRATEALLDALKYQAPANRADAVDRITGRVGATLPGDLMLRADQVRALHSAGMEVGAHTVRHPILAAVDVASARDEIARGREQLESIIGGRVTLFAYPNGRPRQDYGREHARLVESLGFAAAVSTAPGAARYDSDRYQLPRIAPWVESSTRFALRVLRAYRAPTALVA